MASATPACLNLLYDARRIWLPMEDDPSLLDLAASYAAGICKNHAFLDGNKRTSWMAAYVFLRLNSIEIVASEDAVVDIMQKLAGSEVQEGEFAAFLAANLRTG